MSFDRLEHSGNALKATLASSLGSGDTSLTLVDATGWPTGGVGPFFLEIDANTASAEKILATFRSGNVISGLVRGADGTTAVAHEPTDEAVTHVFSALEADEANQAVAQTVGAMVNIGDLLVGGGFQSIQTQPIGAQDSVLIADSNQGTGLRYGPVNTAQLASGAVATGNIADLAVTNAKMAASSVTQANLAATSLVLHQFSVTSVLGTTAIPHGCSFTPRAVFFTFDRAGPSYATSAAVDSIDGTNVNVHLTGIVSNAGSPIPAGQTISGWTWSFA